MTSIPTNEEVLTYLQQQAREHRDEADTCYDKATQAALLGNASATINRLFSQATEHEHLAALNEEAAELIAQHVPHVTESRKFSELKELVTVANGEQDYHFVVEDCADKPKKGNTEDYPYHVGVDPTAKGTPWPEALWKGLDITGVKIVHSPGRYASEIEGRTRGGHDFKMEVDEGLAWRISDHLNSQAPFLMQPTDLPKVQSVVLTQHRHSYPGMGPQQMVTHLHGPFVTRPEEHEVKGKVSFDGMWGDPEVSKGVAKRIAEQLMKNPDITRLIRGK